MVFRLSENTGEREVDQNRDCEGSGGGNPENENKNKKKGSSRKLEMRALGYFLTIHYR
jgi:hypothetical protein